MRYLFLVTLLYSSFSFSAVIDSQKFLYGTQCKANNWQANRESSRSYAIQGTLSVPNKRFNLEVWKHDRLIGVRSAYSNSRGVFLVNVYTTERAPKYPRVVITCQN